MSLPLGTHTQTEQKTDDEELLPVLRKTRTDRGDDKDDSRDENAPPSAKVVVDRIRKPAAEESSYRGELEGGETEASAGGIAFGIL
jgi:hypothetical protein